MKDKRRFRRICVDGNIGGIMVSASEIEILDLSEGGIQFKCTKSIAANSICSIRVVHNETTLTLNGTVTRSRFKGTSSIASGTAPVYEVGMQFAEMPEAKYNILNSILESIDQ